MKTLAIRKTTARLAVRRDALAVMVGNTLIQRANPDELETVQLFGQIQVTAQARFMLLDHGIDILQFDSRDRFKGRWMPPDNHLAERRKAQYQYLVDDERRLELVRRLVGGKLDNQYRVLHRWERNRKDDEIERWRRAIRVTSNRLDEADDPDTLRGMEGHGARCYFRGMRAAITNDDFTFDGRRFYPPTDPVNACLSFGYAILQSKVETAIWRAGLDPYWGALHEPGRGKPALALDLMEPYRPVVDRMVVALLNRRQLGPDDFVDPTVDVTLASKPPEDEEGEDETDDHPVHLGRTGKAVFFRELGKLWRKKFEWAGDDGERRLEESLLDQARQLVRVFGNDREAFEPVELPH